MPNPRETENNLDPRLLGTNPTTSADGLFPSWPVLERVVLRRLAQGGLSGQLLEDCGQNVFLRVWQYRSKYRGSSEGELWQWVCRICDNERKRLLGREARWRRFARTVQPANRDPDAPEPVVGRARTSSGGTESGVAVRKDLGTATSAAAAATSAGCLGEVTSENIPQAAGLASQTTAAGKRRESRENRLRLDPWVLAQSIGPSASETAPADQAAQDNEAFAALGGCLAALPDQLREVIELLYFPPQLSERAAAAVLGCSSSNVHRLKAESMQKLLACMKAAGID